MSHSTRDETKKYRHLPDVIEEQSLMGLSQQGMKPRSVKNSPMGLIQKRITSEGYTFLIPC